MIAAFVAVAEELLFYFILFQERVVLAINKVREIVVEAAEILRLHREIV